MPPYHQFPRRMSSALFCRFRTRLAGRIAKIAEEVGVGPQHHAGIAVLQSGLIGLHRTIEGKEVRVLAVGLGEDPVARRVTFTASLFGPRGCVGDEHRYVAVRARLDL